MFPNKLTFYQRSGLALTFVRVRLTVWSVQSANWVWRGFVLLFFFIYLNDIIPKTNRSTFICGSEHSFNCTYVQPCVRIAEKSILTKTTGQMYEGNRVWSLKAPPSHSAFTLDAHLLWSYGGEEKQKHKNCGWTPSVGLSVSNVSSMKCYVFQAVYPDNIKWLFDRPSEVNQKFYICINLWNICHADARTALCNGVFCELGWWWENSKSVVTSSGFER